MEEKIQAYMCKEFMEYDYTENEEESNLIFGDGSCPDRVPIFHKSEICPSDCKFYGEIKKCHKI